MEIKLQSQLGYCCGVTRAIKLARDAKNNSDNEVYTFGELIHNRQTNLELEKEGIKVVEDINMLSSNDTVVIRSHGIAKSIFDKIKGLGINIIDATCAYVSKIHNVVAEHSAKGYHIIILGDQGHPEIKGIIGHLSDNNCGYTIINNLDFTIPDYPKCLIVEQTTFNNDLYQQIKEKFKDFATKLAKIVVFFDSICYTTLGRQNDAKTIASWADTIFVIGDANSSNTNKLLEIARQSCQNSFLITNVSDAKSVTNKNIAKLGILTGASTPIGLIMEVYNTMIEDNKIDTTTTDVVTSQDVLAPEAVALELAAEAPIATAQTTKVATKDAKKPEEITTMEQAMLKYGGRSYREGMKLKAKIVSIDPTGISVSVDGAGKNDSGFIDKDEVEIDTIYNMENYHIDDLLDVVVIPKNSNSKDKSLNVSKKAYDAIKIDDESVKKIIAGEEFTLACSQETKGGLLGKIGSYTIFVPASQIRMGYVKTLADYINKPLRLKMLPPKEEEVVEGEQKRNRSTKRIIASQRVILEAEKNERENEFWDTMQVNNIVVGKVKRFCQFGAFVSVKNVDCLAHISDLSWYKINDPSEVLEIGKSYDFVVLKASRENDRISLGYKQLIKKPYEIAAEKYPVGSIIKGRVERIHPFGAFVEIEPGIDGLVHVSQIAHNYIKNAEEVLKVGDEIEAKIIGFESNKITLSIKELLPEPEFPEVRENNSDNRDADQEKSRTDKFKKRADGAADSKFEPKKDRRPRREREDSDEPREWVTSGSGATFADLFKDFDMDNFDKE